MSSGNPGRRVPILGAFNARKIRTLTETYFQMSGYLLSFAILDWSGADPNV